LESWFHMFSFVAPFMTFQLYQGRYGSQGPGSQIQFGSKACRCN
jgi:hypothetical protein